MSKRGITSFEARVRLTEYEADQAWLDWVRYSVRRGVRCDVSMESLRMLPRIFQVAPGVSMSSSQSLLEGLVLETEKMGGE